MPRCERCAITRGRSRSRRAYAYSARRRSAVLASSTCASSSPLLGAGSSACSTRHTQITAPSHSPRGARSRRRGAARGSGSNPTPLTCTPTLALTLTLTSILSTLTSTLTLTLSRQGADVAWCHGCHSAARRERGGAAPHLTLPPPLPLTLSLALAVALALALALSLPLSLSLTLALPLTRCSTTPSRLRPTRRTASPASARCTYPSRARREVRYLVITPS